VFFPENAGGNIFLLRNFHEFDKKIYIKLAFAGYTYSWGNPGEDILFGIMDYYGYTPSKQLVNPILMSLFSISISGNLSYFGNIASLSDVSPDVQDITPTVTPVCESYFGQITDIGNTSDPTVFSFAIITDNHLRYAAELQNVVDRINYAIDAGEDIKFVLVLGDIGDSSYRCQSSPYEDVKSVLDQLQVPYIPVIGNHDVWYNEPNGEPTINQDGPQEEIFNDVFSSQYNYLESLLPFWNKQSIPVSAQPTSNCNHDNYFQNFEFDYMAYHFMFLDWVSRSEICLGNPRGGADLQDFAGNQSTMSWFQTHLSNWITNHPINTERVLIFAHHPLSFVMTTIPFSFTPSFSISEYTQLINFLSGKSSYISTWFGGHNHITDIIYSFSEETITDDITNNLGSEILETIITRSVSSWPAEPGKYIRVVRVHDNLNVDFSYHRLFTIPFGAFYIHFLLFIDESSRQGGSLVSREWFFGDGTAVTTTLPFHLKTYIAEYIDSKYKVTLRVTDNTGKKGSMSKILWL
jgi:hypothetical protein